MMLQVLIYLANWIINESEIYTLDSYHNSII